MYCPATPLHVLAVHAAARFAEATQGRFPLSFSARDRPDELRRYARLRVRPRHDVHRSVPPRGIRKAPEVLEGARGAHGGRGCSRRRRRSSARGAGEIAKATRARRRWRTSRPTPAESRPTRATPRPKTERFPAGSASLLALFDCIACDKCVAVCPNDANFAVDIAQGTFDAPDLVARSGKVHACLPPSPTS